MKNFAYFCLGICALCLGGAVLIFSLKYQPPTPSALDELQNSIYKQFTEGGGSEPENRAETTE